MMRGLERNKSLYTTLAAIFLLAAAIRLFFLFFVAGTQYTGWYEDTYHHWQIAYYTLHVGLAQNPPRMWDLGGMEYFWGLAPTFVEVFLLWLFKSASILPFRLFDVMMGSFSAVIVYLIGRKYFGQGAGLLAGIIVITSPMLIEVDSSGMLDPLGLTCVLLAVLLYEKKPYWAGFLVAVSSLTHIDYWFVALAVIFSYLIFDRSAEEPRKRFWRSLYGWLTLMLPYFWFMQTRTGDFLYALRWNFLGNIAGVWLTGPTVPLETQLPYRAVAVVALAASAAAALFLLKNKSRTGPLHIPFLSFVAIQGVIYGFTAYLGPYIVFGQVGRLMIDRLFALDHYYIALLAAIIVCTLFRMKPKQPLAHDRISVRRITALLLAVLFIFLSIGTYSYVAGQYFYLQPERRFEAQVADQIISMYAGGTVVSSSVVINYLLINKGLPYTNLLGSVYAPTANKTEALSWLKIHNVTWILVDSNMKLVLAMTSYGAPFHHVALTGPMPEGDPVLYYVNQTELDQELITLQGAS